MRNASPQQNRKRTIKQKNPNSNVCCRYIVGDGGDARRVPRGVILTALSLFFKNLRDKKHSNCPCFWRLTGQKPRYCCCWCCWCCCCCFVVVVVVVVDDDDVAVLVLNLVSCLCLCFLFLVFVLVLRRLLLSSSSCCCCCPSSFFLSLVVAENRQIGCVSAFF